LILNWLLLSTAQFLFVHKLTDVIRDGKVLNSDRYCPPHRQWLRHTLGGRYSFPQCKNCKYATARTTLLQLDYKKTRGIHEIRSETEFIYSTSENQFIFPAIVFIAASENELIYYAKQIMLIYYSVLVICNCLGCRKW
jgi:hypothetical protein